MHWKSLSLLFVAASAVHAATPPARPVILEPAADRLSVSAADVHMATGAFHDDDGHGHHCSDWQIRVIEEVVWSAPCATGSHRTHIHLGDGQFVGDHTGLNPASAYWLRVRHRDDGGDPDTEWSEWSERFFLTVRELPMLPLSMREVLAFPAPRWVTTSGGDVVPPPGARLRLELVDGDVLLELGRAGSELAVMRRRQLASAAPLRVAIEASHEEWLLPESDLTIHDGDGNERTLYLPSLTVAPSQRVLFWISANGSAHEAKAIDRAPDFTRISRGSPVPWRAVQPGFRIDRVAGGFQLPVNIAFVPTPRDEGDAPLFYVTELYGNIKVVTRRGEVRDYATNLLDFDPSGAFPGPGEIGLTGIAVEPKSGDVVVGLMYRAWPELRVVWPRIVRIRSEDGGLTAGRIETILDMPGEDQAESHQISNITVGPDGKLYVHLGDSFNSALAQDLKTFRGKIIRLDLDGSAPEDNPFYDATDGISATDYIFALGFRNPFGGAWRAADQSLYEVENGPATDRLAQVVGGRNYLWDGTDASMRNFAICTFPEGTAPVSLAFVQRETFEGSGFPESKLGHLFVSESGPTWALGPQKVGKCIEEIVLREDATLERAPAPLIAYAGTGRGSISGMAAGPGGLYFSGLYKDFGYESAIDRGADLFRVRWVGRADFGIGLTPDPLTISLDERSDVPDAERWEWDFGDGATTSERNPLHRYESEGTYLVRLAVTGPRGTVRGSKKVDLRAEGSGLIAEYFATPDLTGSRYADAVASIDFDWQLGSPMPGLPVDEFSARWTGRIRPRFSETYRFAVNSPDTVGLIVGGAPVLDGSQPGGIALDAGGLYDFVLEYTHHSGNASLQLLWESESQSREVVPSSAFFAPAGPRRRAVTK